MFGQPALFHILLANVSKYFLLIIIYCVTILLFVQAFNTHSIHSIELVTIFIFLTLCALSTLHTIIRYYPFKCISLYHKNYIIQIVFPKNHHRFHITFFYSFPSSVSLPPTLLRICKKILYLKIMSMQLSTYSSPFWLLVQGSMPLCLEVVWHHLHPLQSNEGFHCRRLLSYSRYKDLTYRFHQKKYIITVLIILW